MGADISSEGGEEVVIFFPSRNEFDEEYKLGRFSHQYTTCETVSTYLQKMMKETNFQNAVLVEFGEESNPLRSEIELFRTPNLTLLEINLSSQKRYICLPYQEKSKSEKYKCSSCEQELEENEFEDKLIDGKHICQFCNYLQKTNDSSTNRESFNSLRLYFGIENKGKHGSSQCSLQEIQKYEALRLFRIGLDLRSKGKSSESIEAFKKCLEMRLEYLPNADHIDIAECYIAVGMGYQIYNDQKMYEESTKYFNLALVIYRKLLPFDHPRISTTLLKIGWNLTMMKGNENLCQNLIQKCFEEASNNIREKFPDNSTFTAELYYTLGTCYYHLNKMEGDFKVSAEYFEKLIPIYENLSPVRKDGIAKTHLSLGNIRIKEKKYEEALVHFNKSLMINQEYYPPNHFRNGLCHMNIAKIYFLKRDAKTSIMHAEKSLAIISSSFKNEDDKVVRGIYHVLGRIHHYLLNDKFGKAMLFYEKCLPISREDIEVLKKRKK